MEPYPLTISALLERIALETARMSYPGGMSRGSKQVVRKGTKQTIEEYFIKSFPLESLWIDVHQVANDYDSWHKSRSEEISRLLDENNLLGYTDNSTFAIGTKFLNTFMHQLMKYERFRPLWKQLHLPLDWGVFSSLASIRSPALEGIKSIVRERTAYSIVFDEYQLIQNSLWGFIDELNSRPGAEFKVQSRIELNAYLWS